VPTTRFEPLPLPLALDRDQWAYQERGDLGRTGACDLLFRFPAGEGEGPALPEELDDALSLLLQAYEDLPKLNKVFAYLGAYSKGQPLHASPKAVLKRIIPKLGSYRYLDSKKQREFVFQGYRPSSVHVLGRVFQSDFKFRLEDLSYFATHGEYLLSVLHAVGLPRAIDPEAILYCPAIDSPYPFKFAVVAKAQQRNRDAYVGILKELLKRTESDEAFRARTFMELIRGFAKFGPASATPEFQEVELRLWRVLSYLAARLRVKAGRLTDTRNPQEVREFLRELHGVHQAFDELVHLPGRMAAFFRNRFDLELSSLHEYVLEDLDRIAKRIDCTFDDIDRSIDKVAELVSQFRRLGSASPLESLEAKDREVKLAYGDVEAPPPETGWARTYTDAIFTGADKFDTRRYDEDAESGEVETLSDEDLDLGLDMDFSFGGGGGDDDDSISLDEALDFGD
jgi:hypothetical protein